MPFIIPFLPAIIGAGGAITGGALAGGANRRPPSLDAIQKDALQKLITNLLPTATGTPKIDPIQQALMYGNIAQGKTGAENAVTHSLVSRGLGQSGLLGGALTQVGNQAQSNQNFANLGLQEQAIQQKQLSIQDIIGLLGKSNIPGQSALGGISAGIAPILAYLLQSGSFSRGTPGACWILTALYGKDTPKTTVMWSWLTNPMTGIEHRSKLGKFLVGLYWKYGQRIAAQCSLNQTVEKLWRVIFDSLVPVMLKDRVFMGSMGF